jgi:hypothetical protein
MGLLIAEFEVEKNIFSTYSKNSTSNQGKMGKILKK